MITTPHELRILADKTADEINWNIHNKLNNQKWALSQLDDDPQINDKFRSEVYRKLIKLLVDKL